MLFNLKQQCSQLRFEIMHSQGTWPWKIMHPALQMCAHQVMLIFKISKHSAPAGCTHFLTEVGQVNLDLPASKWAEKNIALLITSTFQHVGQVNFTVGQVKLRMCTPQGRPHQNDFNNLCSGTYMGQLC